MSDGELPNISPTGEEYTPRRLAFLSLQRLSETYSTSKRPCKPHTWVYFLTSAELFEDVRQQVAQVGVCQPAPRELIARGHSASRSLSYPSLTARRTRRGYVIDVYVVSMLNQHSQVCAMLRALRVCFVALGTSRSAGATCPHATYKMVGILSTPESM